jgi:hypothetical protein
VVDADDQLVSHHESLASMLAMPQMRPVKSEIDPKDASCRIVTYEGASSPRELLENCVIQARAALDSLEKTKRNGYDAEDEEQVKKRRLEALSRTKEEHEEALKAEAEWDETNAEDVQLKAFWYINVFSLRERADEQSKNCRYGRSDRSIFGRR